MPGLLNSCQSVQFAATEQSLFSLSLSFFLSITATGAFLSPGAGQGFGWDRIFISFCFQGQPLRCFTISVLKLVQSR